MAAAAPPFPWSDPETTAPPAAAAASNVASSAPPTSTADELSPPQASPRSTPSHDRSAPCPGRTSQVSRAQFRSEAAEPSVAAPPAVARPRAVPKIHRVPSMLPLVPAARIPPPMPRAAMAVPRMASAAASAGAPAAASAGAPAARPRHAHSDRQRPPLELGALWRMNNRSSLCPPWPRPPAVEEEGPARPQAPGAAPAVAPPACDPSDSAQSYRDSEP